MAPVNATGLDVTGHRYSELSPQIVDEVVAAYPRLDFKRGFAELIADQSARKTEPELLGLEGGGGRYRRADRGRAVRVVAEPECARSGISRHRPLIAHARVARH